MRSDDIANLEDKLDAALEETFPASDVPAIVIDTGMGNAASAFPPGPLKAQVDRAMTRRVVQFIGIMLVALVAGVFWGTWFTLTRSLETFSAAEFLHIGKTIIANVAVPMRILMPVSLLVMLWAVWLYPVRWAAGFYLLLTGFVLMVVTLLITLLVEVPIDNEVRRWTVETLPGDWEARRSTWKRFHALRTVTSVAGLGAFVWSVLLTSRALGRDR